MGADETCDLSAGDALPEDVDVVFEASGAPAALGPVLRATAREAPSSRWETCPVRPWPPRSATS